MTPFTVDIPDEEETSSGKRLGKARSRLGGDAAAQQPLIPGPSLLGGDKGPGAVSPLRRIDVRVAWDVLRREAGQPRQPPPGAPPVP